MGIAPSTQTLSGYIATADGFVHGQIQINANRINKITGIACSEAEVIQQNQHALIVPGFVDLHVHGAGGADVMDAGWATQTIAQRHACYGTTALLATTLTAPRTELVAAFEGLAKVLQAQSEASAARQAFGARILGVHLEGPYISAKKLGAQPAFTRHYNDLEFAQLHAIAPVRLATIAPEQDHTERLIRQLQERGVVVQLGHSLATYEQTLMALNAGAKGFTHLYNAMSGLHHRAPGMVGAALAHSEFAELIPDLHHVHPGALRAAMRSITRCYCVTDSMAAAGMPDGDYRLGIHKVNKCMGAVRLADGTLAGSSLTMEQAFTNLVTVLQLPLLEAVKRCSTYACEFLGIHDRGVIRTGAYADLVVMSPQLAINQVWVEGILQPREAV